MKLIKILIAVFCITSFFAVSGFSQKMENQSSNVNIIDGLYKSFAKGDVPDVLGRLDAKVVWNEAEGNALADQNPYIGPDAVLNGVFARVIGRNEYFHLKDIQLHDMSNNKVLSTLRYDGKVKSNGEVYNVQAAHLWTLNDEGKVIAFQQYVDTKTLDDVETAGSLPMIMTDNYYLPVSTKSQTAKADYYKAALLGSQIRIGEAKALLGEAIKKDPDFLMAYGLMIYYSSDEEKDALIDKALAIDAKNFNDAEKNVRRQLAIWDKDSKASVAGELKLLVAAYPNTPQAYHWAASNAGFNDNNNDAAIEYALQLAALSPDFGSAYNTLGYAYMRKNEMENAKSAFEKYLVTSPSDANPYDSMGDYLMANKEYNKAAEFYDKAAAKGMSSATERAAVAREKKMASKTE